MNKQQVDEWIVTYLPKIYGFAMKKAFSFAEAEELSSDIVTEVYLSLLSAKEVCNVEGYIWRISEHVYAKFVSSKKKREGISLDGMEIPDNTPFQEDDWQEDLHLLRREIAFLTQTRRRMIYAFYYEKKPISQIAKEAGLPEGTVKWHLNKARNELKGGLTMERKIGKLGIKPIEASSMGHSGYTGNNDGPEYYLGNKLNLNIVYSVYHAPKTTVEIAEELGVTPVYIEDSVAELEANGFLIKKAGNRYTTYVKFEPETYSLEAMDKRLQQKSEVAELLVREYVPKVRAAVADVDKIYIPGGNRELLEAAAVFYAITNKCGIPIETNLDPYYIKTLAGGHFIAFVDLPSVPSDPDYQPSRDYPSYWACGNMWRTSQKYPSVSSWSIDTRYSSREGYWKNNQVADYEYLYEFITGAIQEIPANKDKFDRLRERNFLSKDNKVNVMVVRDEQNHFFSQLPPLDDALKSKFAHYALEQATLAAKNYPPQMRDLVVNWAVGGFIGSTVALMVLDILYENGTFRPLTENEKVTSLLLMFSDKLPQ